MERRPQLTPPPPKEQRRSQPALDSGNTKVCLVCTCYAALAGKAARFFDIFVLDLLSDKDRIPGDGASEDFKPRNPTFRLGEECFVADAFCVVGSTLYMFQGLPHGQKVGAFDLPKSSNVNNETTVELLPSMLSSIIPDVLQPKSYPAAIPTGDGKILVFSNFIKPGCDGAVDFELYDPRTRSAQPLPGLPPQKSGFWAEGHTLHQESSTFFLQTQIGLFSLHLRVPGAQWVRRPNFFNFRILPNKSGASYVIGDAELFFAPSGLYEMKRGTTQLLLFPAPIKFSGGAGVILYDDVRNSGNFEFCIVRGGGLDDETNTASYPRLAISFCHCNVNTLREDDRKMNAELLPNETITSFRFLLNAHEYSVFYPYDIFAL